MKKGISVKGGSKTMVMVGLLAVLLISLGYLSMQRGVREGAGVTASYEQKVAGYKKPPPSTKPIPNQDGYYALNPKPPIKKDPKIGGQDRPPPSYK